MACRRRSSSNARFGSPVSGSWVAWCFRVSALLSSSALEFSIDSAIWFMALARMPNSSAWPCGVLALKSPAATRPEKATSRAMEPVMRRETTVAAAALSRMARATSAMTAQRENLAARSTSLRVWSARLVASVCSASTEDSMATAVAR